MSDFKRLAEAAAGQERAGNFEAAGKLWLEAHATTKTKANRHWCEVRREFCVSVKRPKVRRGRGNEAS